MNATAAKTTSGHPPWDAKEAALVVEEMRGMDGALLPMLHALQARFGHIDAAATPLLAKALNLSQAEVHGVIHFYHDFRSAPGPARVIKLCRAEACQANGCEAIVAQVKAARGVAPDEPNGDGVALETVYCLGNCALGPSALIDGELVGRLDGATLLDLMDNADTASTMARAQDGAVARADDAGASA